MSNDHHHHHHHAHSASKNIGIALILNGAFTIVEVAGGFLTGSIAILSDALHDFGDTLSLGLAYFLEKHSNKASTQRFSYGYRRLSLLSAFITAAVLIFGSVIILWHAIPRLFNPVQPEAKGMLAMAILGIAINGFAAFKIKSGKTMNEKLLTWHLLEDVLGWIAVLVVSVVMMFWDVPILDPLLSIFFTCFILVGVFKSLLSTLELFMQGAPSDVNLSSLRLSFQEVNGVRGIHDLHFWSLDGERHVLSMHVAVDPSLTITEGEAVKNKLRQIAATLPSLANTHFTIELESSTIQCPDLECVSPG